jgi:hypothetical protein
MDDVTRTLLLGVATIHMTAGLLLGFLDAARCGQAKPLFPLPSLLHAYCFSFIPIIQKYDGKEGRYRRWDSKLYDEFDFPFTSLLLEER